MLEGINPGQYLPADSTIHRMDPRAKLICAGISTLAVILADSLTSLMVVSSWTFLVAGLSGIKPVYYWRGLKPLWVLLMLSFFLRALFTPGKALIDTGFFIISWEGLISAGWLLWRLAVVLMVSAAITFTTTPMQLTAALDKMLMPLTRIGLPVREMSMMINLALRFIPTLFQEARLLFIARWSRGASFTRGGITNIIKGVVPFIVPLITNVFHRAEELALALEARCYRVGAVRSRMNPLKYKPIDYMAVLLSSVLLASVIIQRMV